MVWLILEQQPKTRATSLSITKRQLTSLLFNFSTTTLCHILATPLLSEYGISQAHCTTLKKNQYFHWPMLRLFHLLQTSQMTRDAMHYSRKPDPSKHKRNRILAKRKVMLPSDKWFGVDSLTISAHLQDT